MKCVEVYKELYHQEPFDVAFCPYRISPLGAHIDHQYGKIREQFTLSRSEIIAMRIILTTMGKFPEQLWPFSI